MATQPQQLTLTRNQLASFLKDNEQIRQFERLLTTVNSLPPNPAGEPTITTKTSSYTATVDDYTILCDATGGDIVITLPSAASLEAHIYNVKKIDSSDNLVTITSVSTIDSEASVSTYIQWTNIALQSNGTNWFIL